MHLNIAALTVFSATYFVTTVIGADQTTNWGYPTPDVTSDICANVDQKLKVPQPLFPKNLISVGTISGCICLTNIDHFVSTNAVAIAGMALAGKSYVIKEITNMVKQYGNSCSYPSNSVPSCKKDNPCHFDCKNGYTPFPAKFPSSCACLKPYTECNGKCGTFHGCPSGVPHYKRDLPPSGSKCPIGMSACGIWGRNSKTSWECINTLNDLESCGGCMIPLPGQTTQEEGKDCTILPGVSDVSCVHGKCVIHKCRAGYDLHPLGHGCDYNEDKDPQVLAVKYGLEHVPLHRD